MHHEEVIKAHPQATASDLLLRCVDECIDCAITCVACADASLSETDLQDMVAVVRLCLDCADACQSAGRIVARQTAADAVLIRAVVEACVSACRICAEECERHLHHAHCRI